MGIFDFIKSEDDPEFVDEAAFEANLLNQTTSAPKTLEHLYSFGITEESELQLEFYFYTDKIDKAEGLKKDLEKLEYEVQIEKSEENNQLLVTGLTDRIQMNDETIKDWTKNMCELGYQNDCAFDGWGTMIEPEDEE